MPYTYNSTRDVLDMRTHNFRFAVLIYPAFGDHTILHAGPHPHPKAPLAARAMLTHQPRSRQLHRTILASG